MNLHCITYQNIGPFADTTVSVLFRSGAYLIKAPIGTGKSFLFFDGPIFSLYKYASRQMLSRSAEKGLIRCVFTANDVVWLIERVITRTKSGNDSVKSRLWSLTGDGASIEARLQDMPLVQWGTDICHQFMTGGEEVSVTNQKELDSYMHALLPAREVLTSVYIMMQESQHVFELPPAQRVTIFKHLFGMLGVDEAKNVLQKRRREVQGMLALLDDTDHEHKKLSDAIQQIKQAVGIFSEDMPTQVQTIRDACASLGLLHDIGLLGEDLGLDGLMIEEDATDRLHHAQQTLQALQMEGAGLASKRDALQQQRQQLDTQHRALSTAIEDTTKQITLHTEQLSDDTSTKRAMLVEQKSVLLTKSNTIEKNRDAQLFSGFSQIPETLEQAVKQIDLWLEEGKMLAKDIQHNQERLSHYQQTTQDFEKKKQALEQQRDLLDKQYDEQMRFRCDKIEGDCPYVEVIKGAAGRSLQQQRDLVEQQHTELVEQYTNKAIPQATDTTQTTISSLQERQSILREALQAVNRKSIMETYQAFLSIREQIQGVDQQIMDLQKRYEQQEQQRQHITALTTALSLKKQEQADLTARITTLQQQYNQLQDQRTSGGYATLTSYASSIQTIRLAYDRIAGLIEEYTQKKQKKYTLQEELKRLKSLYQIFSKELLVVVLQDFLPQLQQVINAYLAQVVDYEIRFAMPQSADETMELEITIIDHHGERAVKSLSGGQRALLKICWILAVASMMRSKFLFLDETITSLDASAVGRVGTLLKQFVQQHAMKLYVVTHAQQIQDMDLWNDVITITK